MKCTRLWRMAGACSILLACLVSPVFAQNVSGTISGTVKDTTGAVIPNASVVLTDTQRNAVIRTVRTDSSGYYTAPQLSLGTYAISVEQSGFEKALVDNVVLHVNDALTVNLTLRVGNPSQTVTVSASAIQVNVENASSSTLINSQQIVSLPLNNRNYEQLVALQPGVSYGGGDQLYIGTSNPSGETNVVAFSINGQRSSQNYWTVDGASNVDGGSNYTLLIYPNVDAIAEFKTLRNTYSAEFGKSASGQINVVTKSGTNQFHGSAYEFLRNDAFAANSVLNHTNHLPRAPLRYNNFGYSLGGPVWIPKVYNGQNKTFFFFSQEFRRVITYGSNILTGDPTASMRQGIFPADVCVQQNGSGTACAQVVKAGTPVPIDPTAQAYLKDIYDKIPLPNYAADTTGTGLVANLRNTFNETQEIARVDQVFSGRLQGFFRFVNDAIPTIEPNGLFTGASGFPGVNTTSTNSPGRNYLGHATWSITPSFLLDGGYAYSTGAILSDPTGLMATTNSPDIKPALPFTSTLPRVPAILFTNSVGAGLTTFGPYRDYNRDHQVFANISRILGQHSLRSGVAYHHYEKNENSAQSNAGSFTFTNTAAPKGTAAFYQAFAYFLTGKYAAYSQTSEDITPDLTYNQFEVYLQDDWKATPRLTLNLGVRYFWFQQPIDQNGELTTFDPTTYVAANAPTIDNTGSICTKAPCAGGGSPNPNYNTLNGISIGGKNSKYGARVAPTATLNFAPRIGFAYDLYGNGKASLRGGYGIAFDTSLVGDIEQNIFANPPFVNSVNINNASLGNPLSGTISVSSLPIALHATQYQPNSPYTQQFSLDLQQQVVANFIVDIGYVGALSRHLLGEADLNQPLPGAYLTTGLFPSGTVTRTNTALLNGIRPYKGYSAINAIEPWFSANYHSLQASLQKRFTDGSLIDFNYTYSKALTNNQTDRSTAVQNIYNINGEYGPAQYDRRNVFTADFVYNLPFFRDQSGLKGHLLGGWGFAGLVLANSGLPFTVTTSADPGGIGLLTSASAAGARPNQVGNPNSGAPHTRAQWFNKAAFSDGVPNGQVGNEPRGAVRGPGYQRWDLSLLRTFTIYEALNLQFRGETFNTFNHTNFDAVGISDTSGTYGQITGYRDKRIIQLGLKLIF